MKVLVAGGAGYIGSNMARLLALEGHEPVVFDNLSKGHRASVGDVEFVEADLADHDVLVETLKRYKLRDLFYIQALGIYVRKAHTN